MPAKKNRPVTTQGVNGKGVPETAEAPKNKVLPFSANAKLPSLVGSMRDTVLWYGDLISPIDVEWGASK
jgi:hypothetical protein